MMDEPSPLVADWVVDEKDIRAADRAVPGSVLTLCRWPVAFFIAYVGVGLFRSPSVDAVFVLVSGSVIAGVWLIAALGSQGTRQRAAAKLPALERTIRFSVGHDRIRCETKMGHAGEFPLTALTHSREVSRGLLLRVDGNAFFLPNRAIEAQDLRWRALASRCAAHAWPRGLGFTLGLWGFAALVVGYGVLTQH